jgi:hypothetical protein
MRLGQMTGFITFAALTLQIVTPHTSYFWLFAAVSAFPNHIAILCKIACVKIFHDTMKFSFKQADHMV